MRPDLPASLHSTGLPLAWPCIGKRTVPKSMLQTIAEP